MNVKFLTPARAEVQEIIAYYNEKRERLGLEFAVELKQTLLRIRNYPWLGLHYRQGFDVVELTGSLIVLYMKCETAY